MYKNQSGCSVDSVREDGGWESSKESFVKDLARDYDGLDQVDYTEDEGKWIRDIFGGWNDIIC